MTNLVNPYKTPFEKTLELGLKAYDFFLTDVERVRGGSILLNEYVPLLIKNTDFTKGQFRVIRERKLENEGFKLHHCLLVQGMDEGLTPEKLRKNNGLYELLSLWMPAPPTQRGQILSLPNFEISAYVDNWYLDNLRSDGIKKEYNPRIMSRRTINAIRRKFSLPPTQYPNFVEID